MQPTIDKNQRLLEFDRPPLQVHTPDELYERMDESLLRELLKVCEEDSRHELKPNGIHSNNLADWFGMWANTSPSGGLIIVGVRDDKVVEGCSRLSAKIINRLELTADDFCPDAKFSIKRVEVHRDEDGCRDFVLVFRVLYNPARTVKTVSGGVFVRRANRKKQLITPEEIQLLQAEKGEVRFETEPCGLSFPSCFDISLVNEFVSAVRTKRGLDQSHSMEEHFSLDAFRKTGP